MISLRGITFTLLCISSPALIFSATLLSRAECQLNKSEGLITPIGYRSDAYPFLLGLGVANAGVAFYVIWKGIRDKSTETGIEPEDDEPKGLSPAPLPVAPAPAYQTTAYATEYADPMGGFAVSAPAPTSTPTYTAPQKQKTDKTSIITQLASTHLCICTSAPPGTGKTVTSLSWIHKIFDLYPEAYVKVITWKNDPWLGLASIPGCVSVLTPQDIQPLIDALEEWEEILNKRSAVPQGARDFDRKPCWLVLDDYFVTLTLLSSSKQYAQTWEFVKQKLGIIAVLGREFSVGWHVITHSINLASLGIPDANIRNCLNVCALGKINTGKDNREDGGFGAITSALRNASFISDANVRAKLIEALPKFQQESQKNKTPVMLTTMGNPRLTLLPDLRSYVNGCLPQETLDRLAAKMGATRVQSQPQPTYPQPEPVREKTQEEIRQQLEFLLHTPNPYLETVDPDQQVDEASLTDADIPDWVEHLPPDAAKGMAEMIRAHLASGRSKSWIVKEVLHGTGKKYRSGVAAYNYFLAKYPS